MAAIDELVAKLKENGESNNYTPEQVQRACDMANQMEQEHQELADTPD